MRNVDVNVQALIWMRCLILILSLEVFARYLYWFVKIYKEMLSPLKWLMAGTAGYASYLSFFCIYGIIGNNVPPTSIRVNIFITANYWIILFLFLNLVACWKISCNFSDRRCFWESMLRIVASLIIYVVAYHIWFPVHA